MKDKPEQTPTPRTDAAAWPETDVVEASFARQLERELNEAREQLKKTRKHLKDANRGAEINAHALRINADKLAAVTEQQDRLICYIKEIQQILDNGVLNSSIPSTRGAAIEFIEIAVSQALQSLNKTTP